MGFHLLAYVDSTAAGAIDDDIAAVADPVFSRRNLHYIFSEGYKVFAIGVFGASVIRTRLNIPTVNAIGRHHIWPVERSATISDDPGLMDMRAYPFELPANEEIAVESSNDLGAATEFHNIFLWTGTPDWNMNLPRGEQRLTIRATGAVAGVANTWSSIGALTLSDNLRGGSYAIVGAQCFDAGTLAMRFLFPSQNMNRGRALRPGIICQEAIGNKPWAPQMGGMGVFGLFNSFELPQIEILANATGASTQELRLDLVYLGRRFDQTLAF